MRNAFSDVTCEITLSGATGEIRFHAPDLLLAPRHPHLPAVMSFSIANLESSEYDAGIFPSSVDLFGIRRVVCKNTST